MSEIPNDSSLKNQIHENMRLNEESKDEPLHNEDKLLSISTNRYSVVT